jgi:zinc protease
MTKTTTLSNETNTMTRTTSPRRATSLLALATALTLVGTGCKKEENTTTPPGGDGAVTTDDGDDAKAAEQRKKAEEAAARRASLEALPELPGKAAPKAIDFPDPVMMTLDNGLEVIVLVDKEVPLVDVTLAVKAGDIYSPAGSPTLAGTVAALLTEGTTKRKKAVLDAAIDDKGGSISSGSSSELATLSASMLSKDLDFALGVMSEEITMPAFEEEALTKIKDQTTQGVRAEKANPGALAGRLARRLVYGDESAYGRSFPTDAEIGAVDRAKVAEFHAKHYVPNNAMLVIAGDVDPKKVEAMAKKHFGKWAKGEAVAVPKVASKPAHAGKPIVHIISRKASAQANVYLVAPAPRVGEPGWLETQVLLAVLDGGTLSTRLNFVLREQLGLTYGASANASSGYDGGLFLAGGGTKNETVDDFASALMPLVLELGEKPVDAKSMRRTKDFVSGSYALQAEGVGVVASQTVTSRLYGLPNDFWDRYRVDVENVSDAQLLEVGKQVFDRGRVHIIAVGKRDKLEKQLAGIGEIRVYDQDLKRID